MKKKGSSNFTSSLKLELVRASDLLINRAMAMQAGIGLSRIIFIVGAGIICTYVSNFVFLLLLLFFFSFFFFVYLLLFDLRRVENFLVFDVD